MPITLTLLDLNVSLPEEEVHALDTSITQILIDV